MYNLLEDSWCGVIHLSEARGHPVAPVAGSLHCPMVRENLADSSDRMPQISTHTLVSDIVGKHHKFFSLNAIINVMTGCAYC